MTPGNFLPQLQMLRVGGNGFNTQQFIPAISMATTGTRATATNSLPADVIVLDANDEDVIASFVVPLDYDAELDLLDLSLYTRHVSGTSIALQADAVAKVDVAAGVFTDLADVTAFVPATATTINAAFDAGLVSANLSGLDLAPGDLVTVNVVASATTGSGIAHVLGGVLTWRSGLVAYNEDNRGNDTSDTTTNHTN